MKDEDVSSILIFLILLLTIVAIVVLFLTLENELQKSECYDMHEEGFETKISYGFIKNCKIIYEGKKYTPIEIKTLKKIINSKIELKDIQITQTEAESE